MEQEIIPVVIQEATVDLNCKYYISGYQFNNDIRRVMTAHTYPDAIAAAAKMATDYPGAEMEIKKVYYVDKEE